MQRIARSVGYSETAFATPARDTWRVLGASFKEGSAWQCLAHEDAGIAVNDPLALLFPAVASQLTTASA